MRRIAVPLAVATALVIPASAPADSSNAPPGNSGISQYVEVVPTASGSKPSRTRPKSSKNRLSSKTQRKLKKSKDGAALAGVVAITAPDDNSPNSGGGSSSGTGGSGSGSSSKATGKGSGKAAPPKTQTSTTQTDSKSSDDEEKARQVAAAYDNGSSGGGTGSGIGVPLIVLMAGAAGV